MLDIEEIRKELGDYAYKDSDCIRYIFRNVIEKWVIKYFGKIPYMLTLTDKKDFIGLLRDYDEDCDDEELRERRENIDMDATIQNIIDRIPETILYQQQNASLSDSVLFNEKFVYMEGVFYVDSPTMPKEILDCVVEKEKRAQIRWVLKASRGTIETKYMTISPKGGIEENYNDDFYPINTRINELIKSDESSVMILHGKPGTGKTSYIRNLISENSDIKFYWLDSSMFTLIDSSEFINFIAGCKNSVFILEDSESLLVSRDESHNSAMQTLLSISDGMLGDSLKLKFICTFNTDLQNIDAAILRKGRLRIKYEFKDLETKKVKALFKKIGIEESLAKPMPLCDIYNYFDDNGIKKIDKKIGF